MGGSQGVDVIVLRRRKRAGVWRLAFRELH
jgi:hypothetical protein